MLATIVESMTVFHRYLSGGSTNRIFFAAALVVTAAPMAGAEFRLPPSTGEQGQPVVATDAKGGAVIVWQERFPGAAQPLNAIRMQRFDPSGAPLGDNQRVDLLPGDNARNPTIDVADDGSFVIAWEGGATEGPYRRTIWARRFAPDGTPRGAELRVNTDRLFDQKFGIANTRFGTPAVSIAPDGGFVIVWRDDGAKRCNRANIVGRRYTADGTPRGPVFRVNSSPRDTHLYPVIDHDAGGGLVVVWQHSELLGTPDERSEIRGRRFNADGQPKGEVFAVREGVDRAVAPSLVVEEDGSFTVAWLEWEYDTFDPKILARSFSADGQAGQVIEIATEHVRDDSHPKLVRRPDGFTVVWAGSSIDPWVGTRIWSGGFALDGSPLRAPAMIGPGTCRQRGWPDAAPLRNGNVISVWAVSPSHEIEGVRLDGGGDEYPAPSLAPTVAERWRALLPTEELYPVAGERARATRQLGCYRFEAAEATPFLAAVAAGDRDDTVSAIATWALAMVTPDTQAVLPVLLEGIGEDSFSLQHESARGLGVLGRTEGVPPLVDLLENFEFWPIRARAAASLGDIGSKPGLPRDTQGAIRGALRAAIDEEEREGFYDKDDVVRITAARALVRLPSPGHNADRLIMNSLSEHHPQKALSLLTKLAGHGHWDSRLAIPLLSDQRPEIRMAAVRCLAAFGNSSFIPALEDPSPLVRAAAAKGLRSLGQKALMTAGGEIELAARNEIEESAKLQIDATWEALQDASCSNPVVKRTPSRTPTPTPTPMPPQRYLEYSVFIVSDRSFRLTPMYVDDTRYKERFDRSAGKPSFLMVWGRPQISPEAAAARIVEMESMTQAELAAIVESHNPTWREQVERMDNPPSDERPAAMDPRQYRAAPTPTPQI